ncbi:MAG: tetratricopeptide repeat protein [Kiloniellales bacterium]|nr:tetratricopeptide repeat protein [Kiloniellales bacterium]
MMRRSSALILVLLLALPLAARADTASAWEAYLVGDYAAAVAELRGLAEAGDPEAQYALGTAYSDGIAVARDYRQAAAWYEKAAVQGHARAQFSLGFLYHQGAGEGEAAVAPDPARARRWLTLAGEAGNPMAAYLLGRMYHYGQGVPADRDAALRWARRAAQRGIAGGQFEAAVLLGSRSAGAVAWVEAYKWCLLAARQGHPAAAANLEALGERLNVEEIAEAEAAAAVWSPAD